MDGVEMNTSFAEFYKDKKVLITGHTGFKGSWLCVWLHMLGAKVSGYSIGIPTDISMYERLQLSNCLDADFCGDVSNEAQFCDVLKEVQPEIVIHLAAQAIVLNAYQDPLTTFESNIMGTASVLNSIKKVGCVRAALIITTDKCYQNQEWLWGYREMDALGGDDPYSCSKACAELITNCYIKSYFQDGDCQLATARAGNVIGGGDWAEHRLIPDIVRAAVSGQAVVLRHPEHIRPWQHVMEPLYGYLLLVQKMMENQGSFVEAWNFGPDTSQNANVGYVAEKICASLECAVSYEKQFNTRHEAALLRLDCTKAKQKLGWFPTLSLDETLALTADWYQRDMKHQDMLQTTREQLHQFMKKIQQKAGEQHV